MKGQGSQRWAKLPTANGGGDMNPNEILGTPTMTGVANSGGEGGGSKLPAPTNPGTVKVSGSMPEPPKGSGGSSTGGTAAKTSEMAQKVGSPRKGF